LWLRVPDHPRRKRAGVGDNYDRVNLSKKYDYPLLERSVFAAGIPLDDCERIHQLVRERWGALHSELTREMT